MQSLISTIQEEQTAQTADACENDELVSFIQEIPLYLKETMTTFIEKHPNWDQYRLMEAAISGYLLQKGLESRQINRIYSTSMFCKKAFGISL
tara:strand:- start:99 stop:377 length:279 start_codon:yes stop_codon:yes gene_type:complete